MRQFYEPASIERMVQKRWQGGKVFQAVEDSSKKKFYCLSMFPYPSGKLHIGHVRNYTIGDVISRYQRMLGMNVLQPMGWDAFGLPAENAAISCGMPPSEWTRFNIKGMKKQLQRLGFAYDWGRELATCDPSYYRWEQWFFNCLVKKGIAYRKMATVNWDPVDQTVLANEQVINGCGWRSGAPVEKRQIEQWFLRITDYAQELLDDLDKLSGWPQSVITQQRNWIGRSVGVKIDFALQGINGGSDKITVFTTRPDTLMGATYIAVAAEHPLSLEASIKSSALADFMVECKQGGISEAQMEAMEKKGMSLGLNAIHPVSGELLPIYVANFILMDYGTGAVMAVPAHDQRDWEFSQKYGIERKQVIFSSDGQECNTDQAAYVKKGVLANSSLFNGLNSTEAFDSIANWLEERGKGKRAVNFRLRDWGISRQRYWGCPIPTIKYSDGTINSSEDLPVVLPEHVIPKGRGSALKDVPEFYDLGNGTERETDTFDTFFESSWYYARYCCPDSENAMLDARALYWLPVDQYIGGIEHAILHLLYARFFNKLMRDIPEVFASGETEEQYDKRLPDEPFTRLLTQGMVTAETYYREKQNGDREWFNPRDISVEYDENGRVFKAVLKSDGKPVIFGGIEKMSKSKNNGVDPQKLIERYGADTVRLYLMFTTPPEQSLAWSEGGVEGAYRFLKRLWRLAMDHVATGKVSALDKYNLTGEQHKLRHRIHVTIAKVNDDIGRRYTFNTAIAAIMELTNFLLKAQDDSHNGRVLIREGLETIVLLLSPITPHITQALWQEFGHNELIISAAWPKVDETALVSDEMRIVIQVNGKLRAKIILPTGTDEQQIKHVALAHQSIKRFTDGQKIDKVIVVPNRLVNIVTV